MARVRPDAAQLFASLYESLPDEVRERAVSDPADIDPRVFFRETVTTNVVKQYIDSLTAPDDGSDEGDEEESDEDESVDGDEAYNSEDDDDSEDDDSDDDDGVDEDEDAASDDGEESEDDMDDDLIDDDDSTSLFSFSQFLQMEEADKVASLDAHIGHFGPWRASCNRVVSRLTHGSLRKTDIVPSAELQVVRAAGLGDALDLLYRKYVGGLHAFRDRLIAGRVAVGMFLSRFLDSKAMFVSIMEAVFLVSRLRLVPMYCERNEGVAQAALASLEERGIPRDLAMVMLQYPSEAVHTSVEWKREDAWRALVGEYVQRVRSTGDNPSLVPLLAYVISNLCALDVRDEDDDSPSASWGTFVSLATRDYVRRFFDDVPRKDMFRNVRGVALSAMATPLIQNKVDCDGPWWFGRYVHGPHVTYGQRTLVTTPDTDSDPMLRSVSVLASVVELSQRTHFARVMLEGVPPSQIITVRGLSLPKGCVVVGHRGRTLLWEDPLGLLDEEASRFFQFDNVDYQVYSNDNQVDRHDFPPLVQFALKKSRLSTLNYDCVAKNLSQFVFAEGPEQGEPLTPELLKDMYIHHLDTSRSAARAAPWAVPLRVRVALSRDAPPMLLVPHSSGDLQRDPTGGTLHYLGQETAATPPVDGSGPRGDAFFHLSGALFRPLTSTDLTQPSPDLWCVDGACARVFLSHAKGLTMADTNAIPRGARVLTDAQTAANGAWVWIVHVDRQFGSFSSLPSAVVGEKPGIARLFRGTTRLTAYSVDPLPFSKFQMTNLPPAQFSIPGGEVHVSSKSAVVKAANDASMLVHVSKCWKSSASAVHNGSAFRFQVFLPDAPPASSAKRSNKRKRS